MKADEQPIQRPASMWLAWLRVLRAPNYFTVPGDLLVGAALVRGLQLDVAGAVAGAVVVSILLYAAGILLNDWSDREIDAVERPSRPIPSGRVSARLVGWGGGLCLLVGLGGAVFLPQQAFWVVLSLAGSIAAYDLLAKRWLVPGVVTMACCRALNVLLGAAAVGGITARAGWGGPWLYIGIGSHFVFILLVSLIAARETSELPSRATVVVLAGVPLLIGPLALTGLVPILFSGAMLLAGEGAHWAWGVWVVLLSQNCRLCACLWRATTTDQIGPLVGRLVRSLILYQAFWLAAAGGSVPLVLGLVVLWPLSGLVGRRFYGS